MKNILIVIALCLGISNAQAQEEFPARQFTPEEIISGTVNILRDQLRFDEAGGQLPTYIPAQHGVLRSSRAVVSLFTNPGRTAPYDQAYRVLIGCQIEYISFREPGERRTATVTLAIDYNTIGDTTYKNRESFFVEDAAWSRLTITAASVTDLAGNPLALPPGEALFFLRHQLQLERYREPVPTQSPLILHDSGFCYNLHLAFQWEPVDWATEYDVEWTYVDDYRYGYSTGKPLSSLRFDFRHNATRVRVKTTRYEIPAVFERGYVVFRVRAIGRTGADFQQIVNGSWSFPESGMFDAGELDRSILHIEQGFQSDQMNWQYQAGFSEDGKRKDVVRYADGTHRVRQEQTNLSTDQKLLVAETIYDHAGRPAVRVLPAPVDSRYGGCPLNESPAIGFKPLFSQNSDKTAYTWADFVRPGPSASGCGLEARPLVTGAALYYGPENPDKSGAQAFVPDSEDFPFVQTQYTPDLTGRVQRQGGPGQAFQLGYGHEQRYYYGVPAQAELDRIFGNDAGYARHYQKEAVLDENSQMHVQYKNLAGQTVATALAGASPRNLNALERTTPPQHIVVDLIEEDNRRDPGDNSLAAVRSIVITQPTDVGIFYRLTPNRFSPDCPDASGICYDCVYDLEIRLTNECGQALINFTQRIGTLSALTSCDPVPFEHTERLLLEPGTYMISKRLRVNAESRERYVDNFLSQPCVEELREAWEKDAEDGVDSTLCDPTGCNKCLTLPPGISPPADMTIHTEDGGIREISVPTQVLALSANGCSPVCPEDSSDLEELSALHRLIADLSPGGQYAEYFDSTLMEDPLGPVNPKSFPLSVLNETTTNALPVRGSHWRNPPSQYQNSNGSTAYIELTAEEQAANRYTGELMETPDGKFWIRPEQLYTVQDFIEKWQASWALALLPYHPEYGYYVWTHQHRASNGYNARMLNTQQFPDAEAGRLTRHLTEGLSIDPFFTDHPDAAAFMNDSLRQAFHFGGRNFDIEEATYLFSHCFNPAFTALHQMTDCLGSHRPFENPATADDEWQVYRGLYLAKKQAISDKWREDGIRTEGFFSNQSIGRIDGGEYRNKIKRFRAASDPVPLSDERGKPVFSDSRTFAAYHRRRLHQNCGVCQVAKDLETVLTALAYKGRLTSPVRFPDLLPLSLTTTMLDQFSIPRDLAYDWIPEMAGESALHIRVRAVDAGVDICTISLNKVSDSIRWADIRYFSCMAARDDRRFTLTGYNMAGDTVDIQGETSCFRLRDCPDVDAPPICVKTPLADELGAFLNYIFQPVEPRRYGRRNLVVHHAGDRATHFSPALERQFPGAFRWRWRYVAGDLRKNFIADLVADGAARARTCRFTFSILDRGFYLEDIRRIIRIAPGTGTDPYVFVLTAQTADGRTFRIQGKNNCLLLFNCNPLNDNTPELTALCCLRLFPPAQPDSTPCIDKLRKTAADNAANKFLLHLDRLRDSIGNAYTEHCLRALETSRLEYTDDTYQYTLFYYDQAGNLIKTVPPKGVALLDAAEITQVANHRRSPDVVAAVFPAHRMTSTYSLNSLNAVTARTTPDDGLSRNCYDELGRLILSQDAQQRADRACTYLLYDPLGRVRETGRLDLPGTGVIPAALHYETGYLRHWYNATAVSEIYRTYYDRPLSPAVSAHFESNQQHLRNRVASVTYRERQGPEYDHATHYSYDVLGNVNELVQENAKLGRDYAIALPDLAAQALKKIRYRYDLLSGKITQNIYQPGMVDQFVHWYEYDADNRVRQVFSSTHLYDDPALREREAEYTYYQHGPLARKELGTERVQGIDYAYTLQGWLKGINSVLDDPERDMGRDGTGSSARDVFGYALGYFEGDYRHIGRSGEGARAPFLPQYSATTPDAVERNSPDLWNGNIQYTHSRIGNLENPVTANIYTYDQLQRLKSSTFHAMQPAPGERYNLDGLAWLTLPGDDPSLPAYSTTYAYDPNGNITGLRRSGEAAVFDDLRYHYPAPFVHNRLGHIADAGARLPDEEDLPNQTGGNYIYNAKGSLIADRSEDNTRLHWNNRDKLRSFTRGGRTTGFEYDAFGRRCLKRTPDGNLILYVRDASGNTLAEYALRDGQVYWQNSPLYGAGRLGLYKPAKPLRAAAMRFDPVRLAGLRGQREYELNSHTGDVLATVSDRKIPALFDGRPVLQADIRSAQDYYPFGMPMPGRGMSTGEAYRYGFQGMEREDDIKGEGNAYTTEFRQYDVRVGRWMSVEPKAENFASLSPYSAFLNNSNSFQDINGQNPIAVGAGIVGAGIVGLAVLYGAADYFDIVITVTPEAQGAAIFGAGLSGGLYFGPNGEIGLTGEGSVIANTGPSVGGGLEIGAITRNYDAEGHRIPVTIDVIQGHNRVYSLSGGVVVEGSAGVVFDEQGHAVGGELGIGGGFEFTPLLGPVVGSFEYTSSVRTDPIIGGRPPSPLAPRPPDGRHEEEARLRMSPDTDSSPASPQTGVIPAGTGPLLPDRRMSRPVGPGRDRYHYPPRRHTSSPVPLEYVNPESVSSQPNYSYDIYGGRIMSGGN